MARTVPAGSISLRSMSLCGCVALSGHQRAASRVLRVAPLRFSGMLIVWMWTSPCQGRWSSPTKPSRRSAFEEARSGDVIERERLLSRQDQLGVDLARIDTGARAPQPVAQQCSSAGRVRRGPLVPENVSSAVLEVLLAVSVLVGAWMSGLIRLSGLALGFGKRIGSESVRQRRRLQ